ncbi:MAG: 1-deoxy-D-xylulose-5-phosphate synthase, partial [Actinobacteria bacterium]|nr:1-deoxy-D-xylulose-5-phosphate synthase [Actinomycetota bacterium]
MAPAPRHRYGDTATEMLLDSITCPADLAGLTYSQLDQLAAEIRALVVETVTATGGHLGSNLGIVEISLAVHRVFDSPKDLVIWDTGHQAYVHKLLTGRRDAFPTLRQPGGMSGYPSRSESEHDFVENSHASTALSYAHGLATALRLAGTSDRRVVAVVGDGALTGGMAYEALNNLGHSGTPVVIVLNDNGRSYAPTVSKLSSELTQLRLNPAYVHARERLRRILREIPGVGGLAYSGVHGLTSALREIVTPHRFFEALGVRYAGPIDGHDIARLETALANAARWDGPIVVHALTHKGKGYAPAEEDEVQRLHDFKVATVRENGSVPAAAPPASYTDAFTRAILAIAERRNDVVAITAAMPGPTGLLPLQERFPERVFDVGIAEQHALTAAAGMAMGGLRPVVAVYSTFFSRAFDQANLDIGLHGLPVVLVLDRAGVTGDDGPSHHGTLDLSLALSIPGMSVFAPSSAAEVPAMLETALALDGPSLIRFPKTPPPAVEAGQVGSGLRSRLVRRGDGSVCLLAVGKMLHAAGDAAALLSSQGIEATLYDVRVVAPPDEEMLASAASHSLVVTIE